MDKIIKVTDNFQILIGTKEYIIQKLHIVDPRNSPRYNPEKNGESPEVRPEWKDEGCYGLTTSGLQAAIKSIILRESGLSGKEKVSLRGYLDEVKQISNRVFREVDGAVGGMNREEGK